MQARRTDPRWLIHTQMYRLPREIPFTRVGSALAEFLKALDLAFDPILDMAMNYPDFDRYYLYLKGFVPLLEKARELDVGLPQRQLWEESTVRERITAIIGHTAEALLICDYVKGIYVSPESQLTLTEVWFALLFAELFLIGKTEKLRPEEEEETSGYTR